MRLTVRRHAAVNADAAGTTKANIAAIVATPVAPTVNTVYIDFALSLPSGRRGAQGAVFAGIPVFLFHRLGDTNG